MKLPEISEINEANYVLGALALVNHYKLSVASNNEYDVKQYGDSLLLVNVVFIQTKLFVLAKEIQLLQSILLIRKAELDRAIDILFDAFESLKLFSRFSRFNQNELLLQKSIQNLFLAIVMKFSNIRLDQQTLMFLGISTEIEMNTRETTSVLKQLLEGSDYLTSFLYANNLITELASIDRNENAKIRKLLCQKDGDSTLDGVFLTRPVDRSQKFKVELINIIWKQHQDMCSIFPL